MNPVSQRISEVTRNLPALQYTVHRQAMQYWPCLYCATLHCLVMLLSEPDLLNLVKWKCAWTPRIIEQCQKRNSKTVQLTLIKIVLWSKPFQGSLSSYFSSFHIKIGHWSPETTCIPSFNLSFMLMIVLLVLLKKVRMNDDLLQIFPV